MEEPGLSVIPWIDHFVAWFYTDKVKSLAGRKGLQGFLF